MKTPLVLLAVSLLANAALLASLSLNPALLPPTVRDLLQPTPSVSDADVRAQIRAVAAERAAAREAQARRAATARSELWAALDTDDLTLLVTRLRAAGFSRAVILAIVNAKLDARFAERFDALVGDIENLPFWKPDPMNSPNNRAFYEQYSQIYRERSKVARQLLGRDALAWAGTDPAVAQRRQFGDIPKEKIELVQRIVDDYAEMTSQVRAATQGITLPEDREKIALLEREKRADLAAVLTPDELEEYEMRTSPVTSRLRNALTLLDSDADEFRTIFKIAQEFNDRINPPAGLFSPGFIEDRREAQRQMNEKLQAALGAQRFAEFARASNSEFQQLHRIAQKENIPPDMALRAFAIREQIAAESARIADDSSRSLEEKRVALQALGPKARAQIAGTLGSTAAEAYAQVAARWLSYLERGTAFTLGPDGNPMARQPSPPSPTPPRS